MIKPNIPYQMSASLNQPVFIYDLCFENNLISVISSVKKQMLSYVEILLQTLKRNKLNSTQFKIFVDYTSLNAICTLRSKLKKCFRTNQKIKHPDSVGLHFCSGILNHKIVYKKYMQISSTYCTTFQIIFRFLLKLLRLYSLLCYNEFHIKYCT